MNRNKNLITLLVFASAFSSPSYAQMTWYPPVGTWSGPSQLTNELINDSLSEVFEPQSEGEDADYRAVTSKSLTFTPSAARTRTNLKNFTNKTRAYDPAGAAQMEQLFASTDIIGMIGDLMKAYGLNPNDLADVYAVYWVNAWQASRGDNSDISAATYKAVSAQVARGLFSSPEFAAATDAQKQELAEALMIQAAMIAAHMENAVGNPAQLRAIAKAVTQGAKASGLDLANMELTEKGFVKTD